MAWRTPKEAAQRLRLTVEEVRGLCASRQLAWRPRNPDAKVTHYLISDEALDAYEQVTTRPALVKPLRRVA